MRLGPNIRRVISRKEPVCRRGTSIDQLGIMLDPDATKVLTRRILASLIDLGIVVILGVLTLKTTALKFAITERDIDGKWQQTASQFQQLKDLSFTQFVRIQEVGDTMYVFGGRNFWLGVLFAILIAVLVFLLLPAAIGASPGKKLTGLAVVDKEGQPASMGQHFMRSVVGIIDFLPIAGLVGWVVASQDLHTRRLGDIAAKTYVVDSKKPLRMVDANAWHRQKTALQNPLLIENPSDLDSMVELNDRLGIRDEPVADDLIDDSYDADDTSFEPAPVDELDFSLTEADVEDDEETEIDETEIDELKVEAIENAQPLPVRNQTETEWEVPVGTPSPTWSLDELDSDLESTTVAAPAVAASAATVATSAAAVGTAQTAVTNESAGGSATDPVWSAEWNAWLYWDAARERWLRHDQVVNQWVPIG